MGLFMAPPENPYLIFLIYRPTVRPLSVNTNFAWRDISTDWMEDFSETW